MAHSQCAALTESVDEFLSLRVLCLSCRACSAPRGTERDLAFAIEALQKQHLLAVDRLDASRRDFDAAMPRDDEGAIKWLRVLVGVGPPIPA